MPSPGAANSRFSSTPLASLTADSSNSPFLAKSVSLRTLLLAIPLLIGLVGAAALSLFALLAPASAPPHAGSSGGVRHLSEAAAEGAGAPGAAYPGSTSVGDDASMVATTAGEVPEAEGAAEASGAPLGPAFGAAGPGAGPGDEAAGPEEEGAKEGGEAEAEEAAIAEIRGLEEEAQEAEAEAEEAEEEEPPPLCTREQSRAGRWEAATLPRAPYAPSDAWQKSCHAGRDLSGAPWDGHRWVPGGEADGRKCVLLPWSEESFCDVVGGTGTSPEAEDPVTVSLIGDSTTFQHFSSLALLLGSNAIEDEQHASRLNPGNAVVKTVCDGRVVITFLRDDALEMLGKMLDERRTDVVVFNTGIHYREDEALRGDVERAVGALEKWQGECRDAAGGGGSAKWCLPVLRTTVPGHLSCADRTEPTNDLAAVEGEVEDLRSYGRFEDGENFHWWDVKGQNEDTERLLARSGLDYTAIDAYDVVGRRPDLHQGGGAASTTACRGRPTS